METFVPTVLAVDDNLKNIQLLHAILAKMEYKILIATNGANALKSTENESVDLVLLDVMMPEMDGFEVCKRLKSNTKTSDIPVIFMTAKTAVEDQIHGFNLGAVDYIKKPYEAEVVLARVKTHLELRIAQKKIKQYNEELEEMLEERTRNLIKSERQAVFGQLVQGIVHNLRSPLTSVSGEAELSKMYLSQSMVTENRSLEEIAEKREAAIKKTISRLDILSQSAKKLNDMISSMMTKSSSDQSKDVKTHDLNRLIETEMEFLKADTFFKHETTKHIHISENPIYIEVISGDIIQVFGNLTRNALDAMFDSESPEITITTSFDKEYGCFSVQDAGSGIPQDVIDKIFDPFFTTKLPELEAEVQGKPKGTGLGLWMSKETIEGYGGKMEVDSIQGVGTTFTVYIPLSKQL
jgi:signal transduction histidine kinase